MESTEPTPGTEESDVFDTAQADDTLTPPTPPHQSEADQNGAPRKPTIPSPDSAHDELQFLKHRIGELERQTTGRGIPRPRIPIPPGDSSLPEPTEEQKHHQRMLSYMYDTRQQWEEDCGPGFWELDRETNRFVPTKREDGPWDFQYKLWSSRQYTRPDPFDLKRDDLAISRPRPGILTDFDYVIDYGSRRERLRKNFEWDLDRLYLMEEIEKRERLRKEEEAIRQRQAEQAAADALTKSKVEQKEEVAEGEAVEEEILEVEPKLARLPWAAFRRSYQSVAVACGVVVLIGEPIVQDDLISGYAAWFGYSGETQQRTTKTEEIAAATSLGPDEGPLPERIRVRSKILPKILMKITSRESPELSHAVDADDSVVLLRPFKILQYAERGLRDWCSALEKQFSTKASIESEAIADDEPAVEVIGEEGNAGTPTPLESKASDGTEAPEPRQEETSSDRGDDEEKPEDDDLIIKSPEAIKHLQCLLSFIDSDIEPKRTYLRSHQCRKVFFSDLWHLFRPGMEVISSSGKQVYRVVQVSSARHRVVPAWQRYHSSASKPGKAPFSISCVHIDFDGKSLGPVTTIFDFKRFDGQRDVISLDVYPLHLHPLRKADFDEDEWKEIEPLDPAERGARVRQHLVDRGRMFLQVAQVKHMYYAGPTLGVRDEVESQVVVDFETAFAVEDPKQQEWKPELEVLVGNSTENRDDDDDDEGCHASCCRAQNVTDDTYVDGKQRSEYIDDLLPKNDNSDDQPSIAIIPRPLKDLRIGSGSGSGSSFAVSEDELLIMSYRVFGFVLRTRKWAKLDLSYLTEVHPPSPTSTDKATADATGTQEAAQPATTFSRLVLNEKHKHMIVSLIAQHFRDKKSTSGQREQVDIVRGKGKGLILLLHGAPGVGKTSTAEGVAELFQKPLFQITCGDLGTTASQVEKALETTFALANRWDCILLLDEADVFLSQRTKDDFQRNGLVAVFLRVMEYYAGILFLTTNRVGDFDEAFTSRIHVSLYYPDLSPDQTVRVFKLNMDLIQDRFNRKGRRITIDHYEIAGFASQYYNDHPDARWNGRQIRNACQTALALAEFEAQGNDHQDILRPDAVVTLTVGHFETVRDAYLEFTDYINTLWGTNASTRAHEDKLRPVWVDANNNIVAHKAIDKKTAFFRAAQRQSHPEPQHAQPPSHPDQYYTYGNPPPPTSAYHSNPPPSRPAYPPAEPWNTPTRPGARTGQNPDQALTPPQHGYNARMQTPRNPGWPTQDPELYADQDPGYTGQAHEAPHGLGSAQRGPPAQRGRSPAQSWSREVGGH